jgi:hypothetical protein
VQTKAVVKWVLGSFALTLGLGLASSGCMSDKSSDATQENAAEEEVPAKKKKKTVKAKKKAGAKAKAKPKVEE